MVRMKIGSRESSPSVRRSVRTACASALSDALEDVAAMHSLVAMLDEKDEQIEIARDQTYLAIAAQEQSLTRRQREVTKPVALQAEGILGR
jgi:hypothetical protein